MTTMTQDASPATATDELPEDDAVELVKLLGKNFIQRRDAKAIQTKDCQWIPVRRDDKDTNIPFSMDDFKKHLMGSATYGHYLLDQENNCKLFAFDLDVVEGPVPLSGTDETYSPRKVWLDGAIDPAARATEEYAEVRSQLARLGRGLAVAIRDCFEGQVPVAVCDTAGKGLHVYGLTGTRPAAAQRELALGLLKLVGDFVPLKGKNFFQYRPESDPESLNAVTIEVFPKQDTLQAGGLGNLLALPLGVNRRTGGRREFVAFDPGADPPFHGWRHISAQDALTKPLAWESVGS